MGAGMIFLNHAGSLQKRQRNDLGNISDFLFVGHCGAGLGMTGYIWECEKCVGKGTIWIVPWDHAFSALQQASPRKVVCYECDGRGYWEP